MMLVEAGYGSWIEVNKFSAEDVFDILERESIKADIEHYKIEQSKSGN